MRNKNAIILCSGGLDSVVTSFYAKKNLRYKKIVILFFDYGQKSVRKERDCAKKCARSLGGKFVEIKTSLGDFSGSLINTGKKYKKLSRDDLKDTEKESTKYYVPSRNLVFLSYATALAESFFMKNREKYDIFVGFKNEGGEHYPDTSAVFLRALDKINVISSLSRPKIIAPVIKKDKEDIIKLGIKMGLNLGNTFSCYVSGKKHCGWCLACMLRKEGFYWADVKDPTVYKR